LETAGSQKERKTEAKLEKDCFGGSRKMRQNMKRGSEVGGQQSQMEMLHKCPEFLMERKDILLLLLLLLLLLWRFGQF
jgi:hypothetical protein